MEGIRSKKIALQKDFTREKGCLLFFFNRFAKKRVTYYKTHEPSTNLLPKEESKNGKYFFERYHSSNDFFNYHSEVVKANEEGIFSCSSYKQLKKYFTNVLPLKIESSNRLLEQRQIFYEGEEELQGPVGLDSFNIEGASGFTLEALANSETSYSKSKNNTENSFVYISFENLSDISCCSSSFHDCEEQHNIVEQDSVQNIFESNLNCSEISNTSRPWKSFAIEKKLIKIVKTLIESSSLQPTIEEDRFFVSTLSPTQLSYFSSTYRSLQDFISFHSYIFKVDENGLKCCANPPDIKSYLASSCYHKAFFPDYIERLEKQCIRRLCKALRKYTIALHVHDSFLINFFSKAKQVQKNYISETYICVRDFIIFHCEILSINSHGEVSCASEEDVLKYINCTLHEKLEDVDFHYSRRKIVSRISSSLPDSLPCFENKSETGNCGILEKRFQDCCSSSTQRGKALRSTQISIKKEVSTQTTSTGPILSKMQFKE